MKLNRLAFEGENMLHYEPGTGDLLAALGGAVLMGIVIVVASAIRRSRK